MTQTQPGSALKVLVADDHWIVRLGLTQLLKELGRELQVVEAADGVEALTAADRHDDLDLVLLDLKIPGGDGFEALRALRKSHPNVPVIVISVSEDRSDILHAIDFGAHGYVPKSALGEDILKAVKLVLSGEMALPRRLLEQPTVIPSGTGTTAWSEAEQDQMEARLTNRQREIYGLLSQGLSNADIAGRLGLSVNTVRVHIHGILQRLQLENRMQVVLRAARSRVPASPEGGSNFRA